MAHGSQKFNKTKYIAIALCLSMLMSAIGFGLKPYTNDVQAAAGDTAKKRYAPDKFRKYGITYKDLVARDGEPGSATLLVGTYLIFLLPDESSDKEGEEASNSTDSGSSSSDDSSDSPITGEVYMAALKSKITYQQNVYFYKSELGESTWMDLDLANSLKHIGLLYGTPIEASEMDNMLITVIVKGNKIIPTVPEGSGDEDSDRKNPFLLPSPYNLDEMEAMEDILGFSYTIDESKGNVSGQQQSSTFLNERLRYLFAHDEVTDTIKLQNGDFERALLLNNELIKTQTDSDKIKANIAAVTFLETTESTGALSNTYLKEIPSSLKSGVYSDKNAYSAGRLLFHFSDTRDEITEPMDKAVETLWDVYLDYHDDAVAKGEEDEGYSTPEGEIDSSKRAATMYNIIAICDATRRAQAYYNLAINEDFHGGTGPVLSTLRDLNRKGSALTGLNINYYMDFEKLEDKSNLFEKIFNFITGNKTTNESGGFIPSAELDTMITEAVEKASNAYVDYSDSRLSRGISALTQLIYDDYMQIIEHCKKDDETDALITEVIFATNIRDGSVYNATEEAKLLKDKLIGSNNTIFAAALQEAEPEGIGAYAAIINSSSATEEEKDKAASDAKALLLSAQTTTKNVEKSMEQLIEAYIKRVTDKDLLKDLLTAQLNWAVNQKAHIPDSRFKEFAEEVRYTYETYIRNKMRDLGLDTGDGESEELEKMLEEAKKKAINDNDPKYAKEIEKLIDKYKNKPVEVPPGYTATIDLDPSTGLPTVNLKPESNSKNNGTDGAGAGSSGSSSETGGDGSGGNGTTGGGTGGDGIDLGDGDGSGLGGNGGDSSAGGGDDSGNWGGGDSAGGELPYPTGDALSNLEALIGSSFDDMGEDAQAALVAALNQYGRENKNYDALELARDLLARIMAKDNPMVFTKYKQNDTMEYVSLAGLDRSRKYSRYRLVKKGIEITMSRLDLGISYVYKLGSIEVKKVDGKSEELVAALASQKDEYLNREEDMRYPYLDEEDAQKKLNCRAEYIEDTDYAILVLAYMEPLIEEYLGYIAEVFR